MNKTTINNMINNSTWVSTEHNAIFKFSNGKDLAINGKKHLHYSLSRADDRIVIQIGVDNSYYVDYIDDFTLCFYNKNKNFRIKPE